MKRSKFGMFAAGVLACSVLAACGADDSGSGDEGKAPEKLVLGLVPSGETTELVKGADKLGELLSKELGIPVETTVSADYTALVVAMQTGKADIGMFGPVALVQAIDQADAEAVLQSVRFGASTYHTQWFTNDPKTYCMDEVKVVTDEETGEKFSFCNGTDAAEMGPVGDDAVAKIAPGTKVSFVDQSSASGYYYPATQWGEATDKDPLTGLEATFAGDHDNAVLSVAKGDAPVGVSFADAREGVSKTEKGVGEKVTVFAYSAEIPNDGVAVSGDLSDEWQQKITEAFLALAETEEGLAVLDAVYEIEGLVPADLDALDAARQVAINFGE